MEGWREVEEEDQDGEVKVEDNEEEVVVKEEG